MVYCKCSLLRYSIDYLDVGSVLGVFQCVGSNVTVLLSTDFPSDEGHYMVHGKPVTLQCIFTSAAEITWKIDENIVLVYSIGNEKKVVADDYSSKVKGSHYSSHMHTVILNIDKTSDEGSTVACITEISPLDPTETGTKDLVNILGEYALQTDKESPRLIFPKNSNFLGKHHDKLCFTTRIWLYQNIVVF